MFRRIAAMWLALALSACASTSVMQLSQNEIMLTTSAAPACGPTGSQQVAQAMAAVETLRRGYARYLILGAETQNNVGVVQSGPTYSDTFSTSRVYGNSVETASSTYYSGQQAMFYGSHDTMMRVVLLKPGDRDYERGVDAKATLGPDWQQKVKDGVDRC
jgi:hypothetical protein